MGVKSQRRHQRCFNFHFGGPSFWDGPTSDTLEYTPVTFTCSWAPDFVTSAFSNPIAPVPSVPPAADPASCTGLRPTSLCPPSMAPIGGPNHSTLPAGTALGASSPTNTVQTPALGLQPSCIRAPLSSPALNPRLLVAHSALIGSSPPQLCLSAHHAPAHCRGQKPPPGTCSGLRQLWIFVQTVFFLHKVTFPPTPLSILVFFFFRLYLFIFRGKGGREKGRKTLVC